MGSLMADSRKKRMSLLDNLAAAGAQTSAEPASMMSANRALRSARDAVDGHNVWDLEPSQVVDERPADRIDPADVEDLRDAIEANGQTVPILVRRDPQNKDRYLLVYGRRRLEAIQTSDKVEKIRAIVANMDDDAAVRAQISENMARRDLSFIEKALLARSLVDSGFGNQTQIAEVLTVTKSAVSMALSIAETIGEGLARTIGAAHGVGRPKWDALARALVDSGLEPATLIPVAQDAKDQLFKARIAGHPDALEQDASIVAFDAVLQAALPPAPAKPKAASARTSSRRLTIAGRPSGSVKRNAKGLTIALEDGAFADWIEREAQALIDELHARFQDRNEDQQ